MTERRTKAQLVERIKRLEKALGTLLASHRDYTEWAARADGSRPPDLLWSQACEKVGADALFDVEPSHDR